MNEKLRPTYDIAEEPSVLPASVPSHQLYGEDDVEAPAPVVPEDIPKQTIEKHARHSLLSSNYVDDVMTGSPRAKFTLHYELPGGQSGSDTPLSSKNDDLDTTGRGSVTSQNRIESSLKRDCPSVNQTDQDMGGAVFPPRQNGSPVSHRGK